MNTQPLNRPVDVLRVLDRQAAHAEYMGEEQMALELRESRAAVVELIEAHRKIAALPYQRAATNGCAYEAVAISRAALANIGSAP